MWLGRRTEESGRERLTMMEAKLPVWVLFGLGATQIIGYGTLYYCLSILVPDIAHDLAVSEQWVFGIFSVALLIGAFAAPMSGKLADRWGAGRVMAMGSIGSTLTLVLTSISSGPVGFAVSLTLMQVVSAGVLYSTAFTAIVQAGGRKSRTSIVHLTLIAGFASSLFWPLTTWLHGWISWREVLMVYATMHILVCLPVHVGLARLTSGAVQAARAVRPEETATPMRNGTLIFVLMLLGFAIEGYALSAMLVHMVPLTQALGLGTAGLLIASLFGPAQVASRLINLVFGGGLPQMWLAVIAAVLMPIGIVILLSTIPWFAGAVLFAVCMGLGSGLTSIVGGTLPLELFGRNGYGSRLGWCTSAKQVTSAIAPVFMSMSMAGIGVHGSLWVVIGAGLAGAVAFALIPLVIKMSTVEGTASFRTNF
ncbi:MFS family permease [Pararhizobium capsulatum DSM 1112]|uniref:MFS family permease n=1 Tax=Pararhizobium capsulatum DSM 1112 TaxID=1121113 RepID=A0ABU0BPT7_9HYPH|nr:arsenite efflux MFS transporter ArsK [Pararhizobium capsulatum]MDQ0320253.1 MFS family permease [Pararhizobium capsulatum DSM 1112]